MCGLVPLVEMNPALQGLSWALGPGGAQVPEEHLTGWLLGRSRGFSWRVSALCRLQHGTLRVQLSLTSTCLRA